MKKILITPFYSKKPRAHEAEMDPSTQSPSPVELGTRIQVFKYLHEYQAAWRDETLRDLSVTHILLPEQNLEMGMGRKGS